MQKTVVFLFLITRLIFDRHSYENSCFFHFDMNRGQQRAQSQDHQNSDEKSVSNMSVVRKKEESCKCICFLGPKYAKRYAFQGPHQHPHRLHPSFPLLFSSISRSPYFIHLYLLQHHHFQHHQLWSFLISSQRSSGGIGTGEPRPGPTGSSCGSLWEEGKNTG